MTSQLLLPAPKKWWPDEDGVYTRELGNGASETVYVNSDPRWHKTYTHFTSGAVHEEPQCTKYEFRP